LRQLLTERYRERLAGVLSCYDRIIRQTGRCQREPRACRAQPRQIGRTAGSTSHPRMREPGVEINIACPDCGWRGATRLGRPDLEAKVLDDVPDAL
jgi:hypothetical protein